ncbi:hypothetical protein [Bradyrhizobium sp.]|uniref:hypothetical protein n=1 Tax=Bradyrhizobium sp. TaxID=376 RepID=UPI002616D2E1|nr:hypothetical protein [Bradyrhizobium sp.]
MRQKTRKYPHGVGIALALAIFTPCMAQNSKLNAPISRQPTVGSEIDRGQDAAFDCGLHNLTNFAEFVACLNDIVTANRQKSTLSEPFQFGLYVRALQHAYVQHVALEGNVSIWRDSMVKIMKSNKLSFKDFCDAVGSGKCEPVKINEQTFGSATAARH